MFVTMCGVRFAACAMQFAVGAMCYAACAVQFAIGAMCYAVCAVQFAVCYLFRTPIKEYLKPIKGCLKPIKEYLKKNEIYKAIFEHNPPYPR